MALIKCSECGKAISDKAHTCPNCGCPVSWTIENQHSNMTTRITICEDNENISAKQGKKIIKRCIITVISIIAFIVVGFFALTIYWGVTDKPLDNDFDAKIEYELDGLTYYVPGNWKYDEEQSTYYQNWYYRYDNFDNFAAAMMVGSFDDDGRHTVEEIISVNSDGKENVVKDEVMVGTQQLLHASYLENEDGASYCCDVYAAECDNWVFMVYFQCTEDFYNQEVIAEIVEAIDFENYENPNKPTDVVVDNSKVGVVENIYTSADIPNELMNDEFKRIIDLFSKGFSQSGLDITNATTYDNGETYIFYLENLEFLGDECEEGSNVSPRIIYDQDAINNDRTPTKMFFAFANPLKSNGYEETVEMVEDIAEALNISETGLINNDYSSSSKWATGEYATFTFPNLNLKLTVSNTDGTVEIEIVPID